MLYGSPLYPKIGFGLQHDKNGNQHNDVNPIAQECSRQNMVQDQGKAELQWKRGLAQSNVNAAKNPRLIQGSRIQNKQQKTQMEVTYKYEKTEQVHKQQ